MLTHPKLSVVIPVYNEEPVLPTLFARLYPALDALKIAYEIVFVNDGSKDRSVALLRQQFSQRPKETRLGMFHANFGQHSAVIAGFGVGARRVRGHAGCGFAEPAGRDREIGRHARSRLRLRGDDQAAAAGLAVAA